MFLSSDCQSCGNICKSHQTDLMQAFAINYLGTTSQHYIDLVVTVDSTLSHVTKLDILDSFVYRVCHVTPTLPLLIRFMLHCNITA